MGANGIQRSLGKSVVRKVVAWHICADGVSIGQSQNQLKSLVPRLLSEHRRMNGVVNDGGTKERPETQQNRPSQPNIPRSRNREPGQRQKAKIGGDKGQGPQILDVSKLQDFLHDTKVDK